MNGDPVKDKGVILEVLAGLDVVLILICPVELDFLALVGDRVHAFLIPALGNEIAVLIIPVEEGIERGINIRLQRCKIGSFCELLLKLQILLLLLCSVGEGIYGHPHFRHAILNLLHFGTDFFLAALREGGKSLLHHLRQALCQKLLDLRLTEIHHPINTKIEVGFVELKDFLQ